MIEKISLQTPEGYIEQMAHYAQEVDQPTKLLFTHRHRVRSIGMRALNDKVLELVQDLQNIEPPIFVETQEVLLASGANSNYYDLSVVCQGPIVRVPSHFHLTEQIPCGRYGRKEKKQVVARSDKEIEDGYSHLDLSPLGVRRADARGKAKIYATRDEIKLKKNDAQQAKNDWFLEEYGPIST